MTRRLAVVLGVWSLVTLAGRGQDELPPDARKLVEAHEKAAEGILNKAEAQLKKAQEESDKAREEVRQRKAKLIEALEALAARLEKEGKKEQAAAIAERAEELKTGRIAGAQPDPGSPGALRGQNGKEIVYDVTGKANGGAIWGTDIYTDDSTIAVAAVHAGILKDGERGAVKVTILAGEQMYQGTTRNGVTTSPYMQWGGSYKVEAYRKGKR